MLTKKEAEREGNKLLCMMTSQGWKLDVWENLGWHYAIYNGFCKVYPSYQTGKFFCFLGDHGGMGFWTEQGSESNFLDPNMAVEKQAILARKVVNSYLEMVEQIESLVT